MKPYFFSKEVTRQNVLILTLDRPDRAQNVFSEAVLQELDGHLEDVRHDGSLRGIVFATGKEDFTFGADVEELGALGSHQAAFRSTRAMQDLFYKVSLLPIPSVTALKGTVIGAGVELATSCSWRLASDDPRTNLCLPEIYLGFLPAAGATHRLPRLIGLPNALEMMLSGRAVKAKAALKMGLVDELVSPTDLLEKAVEYALRPRPEGNYPNRPNVRRTETMKRMAMDQNPAARWILKQWIQRSVEKKTRGHYPAYSSTIETVFGNFNRDREDAFLREAEAFADLIKTEVSQNLFYLFQSKRALRRGPRLKSNAASGESPLIERVKIIGSGRAGAELAALCKEKGLIVSKRNGKGASHPPDVLVIEGRDKNHLALTYREVAPNVPPSALLLFIAPVSHFVEPPDDFPSARVAALPAWGSLRDAALWEFILFKRSQAETSVSVQLFSRQLGKLALLGPNRPAFFLSRLRAHWISEALHCVQEGVSIEEVDEAALALGFSVAPFSLIDEIGWATAVELLGVSTSAPYPVVVPEELAWNVIFQGKAPTFYLKTRLRRVANQAAYHLFLNRRTRTKKMSPQEIGDRLLYRVVNEAIRAMSETGSPAASEADAASVLGIGFPAYLGGPIRFVRQRGTAQLIERLTQLESQCGPRFRCAESLSRKNLVTPLFPPAPAP